MTLEGIGAFALALNVILAVLGLSLLLAFVRLVRGPSLPDRVVALELTATLSVGFIAVYDVVTDQTVFLDVAVVLALVGFLGAVAFSHYIQRSASR